MTNKEPVQYMADVIGARCRKGKITVSGKQSWQVEVTGQRCKKLIVDLLPYLKGKVGEAKLALKFPIGIRYNKYSLSDVDRQIRSDITYQLKELKRLVEKPE